MTDLRKQAEAAWEEMGIRANTRAAALRVEIEQDGYIDGWMDGALAAGQEAIQLSVLREHWLAVVDTASDRPKQANIACICDDFALEDADIDELWPAYLTHLLEVSQEGK